MFLVPAARYARDLPRGLDRLFDDTFERFLGGAQTQDGGGNRSPALDVAESERCYTVRMDLPGVAKSDVKVAIDGRRVTVNAQGQTTDERKNGERIIYRERSMSNYARSFDLPSDIDQTESQAALDNGVLTLTLAKRRTATASQLAVR